MTIVTCQRRYERVADSVAQAEDRGPRLPPIPADLKAALGALPFPLRKDGAQVDSGYFFWSGTITKVSARGMAGRLMASVFAKAKVPAAHVHRFRHTLATDILARGRTMADVAGVLGISEHIARRHYAKWSAARQERISTIMQLVHAGGTGAQPATRQHEPSVIQ